MVESLVIDDPLDNAPCAGINTNTNDGFRTEGFGGMEQSPICHDPRSLLRCTGTKPCVLAFASSLGADVFSMPPPGEAPNIGLKQPVAWFAVSDTLIWKFPSIADSVISSFYGIDVPQTVVHYKRNPSNPRLSNLPH